MHEELSNDSWPYSKQQSESVLFQEISRLIFFLDVIGEKSI